MVLRFRVVNFLESSEDVSQYPPIGEFLHTYADIFEEPKSLPPFRANHNHKIPHLKSSNPVNQRSNDTHCTRRMRLRRW